jgi:hypothetical protein
MAASDDARQAIAGALGLGAADTNVAAARRGLAAVMPDGRTIAQHLDDGARLHGRLIDLVEATRHPYPYSSEAGGRARSLLARLEADRG